jgi:hypothetical protein
MSGGTTTSSLGCHGHERTQGCGYFGTDATLSQCIRSFVYIGRPDLLRFWAGEIGSCGTQHAPRE